MKKKSGLLANKLWVFLLWGILASAIGLALYKVQPSFIHGIDAIAGDARFKARGKISPLKQVVVIAIDEKSINELGRWPWPRTTIAKLVNGLAPAKVAAFDIVFSEPETKQRDDILGDSIKKSGKVILGYFLREEATQIPNQEAIQQLDRSKIKLIKMIDNVESLPLPQLPGIETNIPVIGKGAAGFGLFNIFPDENDGVVRRSQLIFLYNGDLYPSLALEALRRYQEGNIILNIASYGVDNLFINNTRIPTDEVGRFQLNFYGPGGTFDTYSAVDIIKGRLPKEAVKDKIVFVGATEKGIYDLRVTPLDPLYPGVEVHATVAANVIENRFLMYDNRVVALDVFLIIILPLGLCLALTWIHRTFISLAIFISFLSFHTIANFYLFSSYNLIPSAVYPAISLFLAYFVAEAYRNLVVESKGRYLKKAFGTYVSPSLVSEILKDPDRLKLGGEKREITILFSDIRGFTTLSERLSPEQLVSILNEYLSPMTRIVLEEKGTLDKYIGDAIMVICNAPIDLPEHPQKGCSIALRWIKELEKLNGGWKEKGYPSIGIGVGINTGDAVVGNMGADLRFDYTAIGDNVNLASRLEGMNKVYGTAIIVNESTQKLAQNDFLFRELDLVRVKGKEKPVAIYELIDFLPADTAKTELASSFLDALNSYKNRSFEEARVKFSAILNKFHEDGPAKLYVQRCTDYLTSPPSPDWNGVYIAKAK
ncbi:MAG: adenylate/guanylate cyclase domain-containing protein [Deltaproteobacteria bacterium]|nr:adenylate/guanylate cyclase domain-containing protein [Deltaproteobacteria bacterium]